MPAGNHHDVLDRHSHPARPDTLRHALKTVLGQTDGDYEVIVHESGNDPGSAAVVAEFDDARIRFFKTVEPSA
jgi:hypothetical protein